MSCYSSGDPSPVRLPANNHAAVKAIMKPMDAYISAWEEHHKPLWIQTPLPSGAGTST